MDEKPPLGPIPTINIAQMDKDRAEWEAKGSPVTTPENEVFFFSDPCGRSARPRRLIVAQGGGR